MEGNAVSDLTGQWHTRLDHEHLVAALAPDADVERVILIKMSFPSRHEKWNWAWPTAFADRPCGSHATTRGDTPEVVHQGMHKTHLLVEHQVVLLCAAAQLVPPDLQKKHRVLNMMELQILNLNVMRLPCFVSVSGRRKPLGACHICGQISPGAYCEEAMPVPR